MKVSSISELKKELQLLSAKDLSELCVYIAKYKKDNKEYLDYLLFSSHDKEAFIKEVKEEIDLLFSSIDNKANLYYIKKSLRKILRLINKYCKYIGNKALSAELHIYFCAKLKNSGIPFTKSQLIMNMYAQELKKINSLVATLHEDLQGDYTNEIEKILL